MGSVRVFNRADNQEGRVPPLSPTDFAGVIGGYSVFRGRGGIGYVEGREIGGDGEGSVGV